MREKGGQVREMLFLFCLFFPPLQSLLVCDSLKNLDLRFVQSKQGRYQIVRNESAGLYCVVRMESKAKGVKMK